MAKPEKIPLGLVPGGKKPKKWTKKKYGPYPKKNGANMAKLAELLVEVAKLL